MPPLIDLSGRKIEKLSVICESLVPEAAFGDGGSDQDLVRNGGELDD